MRMRISASAAIVAALALTTSAFAGDLALLLPAGTIPLPGVEGRIDHLAASPDGRRLFVAALGSDRVERIDTERRLVTGSIGGVKGPQGVCFLPNSGGLAVASGGDGNLRVYDRELRLVGTVGALEDADNVRYDAATNLLYVGYGQGALAVIDADRVAKVAEIPLDGHPESFQLERAGKRIFVNVPSAGEIEIVDREKRRVTGKWKPTEAAANFPMALDESGRRLFAGFRAPARLVAFDSETGTAVTNLSACGDTDDLFYDSANRQIYLSGGAGCISVFEQGRPSGFQPAYTIATPVGARTSLFVPANQTLYVAVPHRETQAAEILIFRRR